MSQLGSKFTREDREHRSYREKPAGSNEVVQGVELIQEAGETVKVKALNVLVAGSDYDTIDITYPTTTQEVYIYKLLTVSIQTVTIDYVNASKDEILKVFYS